jgi:hypothetical protein
MLRILFGLRCLVTDDYLEYHFTTPHSPKKCIQDKKLCKHDK